MSAPDDPSSVATPCTYRLQDGRSSFDELRTSESAASVMIAVSS
jgi:hypothetical protein